MPDFDNLREPGAPRRTHGDALEDAVPSGDEPAREDDERTGLLAATAADRAGDDDSGAGEETPPDGGDAG